MFFVTKTFLANVDFVNLQLDYGGYFYSFRKIMKIY